MKFSEIKYQRMEQHQNKVCEAIYKILSSFSKIDIDNVKEFLQFDKLNDIFSRTYSASSIGSMSGKKTNGIIRSGAANFIYKVYENENIKQLKADFDNRMAELNENIRLWAEFPAYIFNLKEVLFKSVFGTIPV